MELSLRLTRYGNRNAFPASHTHGVRRPTVFRFLLATVAILVHVCHVEVVPPTKTSAEKCRINNAAKPLAFLARSTDTVQRDGARPRVCHVTELFTFIGQSPGANHRRTRYASVRILLPRFAWLVSQWLSPDGMPPDAANLWRCNTGP